MAQDAKTINTGCYLNKDSLLQAWRMEQEVNATEKRESYLKLLENAHKDTIVKIDLNRLYIHELPNLSKMDRAKEINAANNRLVKIRKGDLPGDSLQKITFSINELKKVCLSGTDQLINLNLNNNKLKRIPRSIRKAKNLKHLDLEDNQIKRIPRFIKKLDGLAEINLNYNQVKFNASAARRLAKIEIVMLAGNKLTELPENIGEMKGVRKFNFSKNQLSYLPSSFQHLEYLTNIIFYQNKFNEFPNEILYLKNLVELDFYYNKIKVIPDDIKNLGQLKQLFLSFNQITELPDSMQSLDNLKYLFVHHNNIVVIPDWITKYTNLERLDLSYNNIFTVPNLSEMKNLTEVDLQENQIEYFPWSLLDKPNLRILVIKNNPFILNGEEVEYLKSFDKGLNDSGLILVY